MLKKLERRLGLGAVISISIGSMLGSGIFVLPGVAFGLSGPHLFLAFFLSAICVIPAAVSKSELATAMPTSGGTYVYLERTFGPLAGTVSGIGLYMALLLKSAFALVGFGAYLEVVANVPIGTTALGLLGVIVVLNILGVGKASSFVTVIVAMAIIGLAALTGFSVWEPDFDFRKPLEVGIDMGGVVAATALVFVAFAGVTKIAAIAEEIKDPGRNLPRGIFLSLAIVTTLYCTVTYVLAGMFPQQELVGNLKPIFSLAEKVGGQHVGIAAAVIAILTMTSMANAGIMAASRFPFAMGRDNLLPAIFGQINQKFLTPTISILMSGVIVAASIIFLDVVSIAKLASAFVIMMYMVVNVSVIVLRETRVHWYTPAYKSFAYPFLQLFGIAACVLLLVAIGGVVPTAIMSICIPGFVLYFFFSRKRTDRRGVLGLHGPRKDLVETNGSTSMTIQQHLEEIHFTDKANVVVAMFGNERAPEVLTEMGLALAEGTELEVAHITSIPEQTDLDDIRSEPVEIRSIRRRVNHMSQLQRADVNFDAVVSHDIFKTVNDISLQSHCEWLVVEWGGKTSGAFTLHNPMGWLRDHLSCNLMTFRDKGVRYFKKILVLVQTDRSNSLLLRTASHLARVNEAEMTLCTYVPPDVGVEVIDWQEDMLRQMCSRCEYAESTLIVRGKQEWSAYTNATEEYDLVIFEDKQEISFFENFFGTMYDKIMEEAFCSVVSVRPSRATRGPKTISEKLLRRAKYLGTRGK